MKNLKKIFVASVLAAVAQMSWAQIGYQVSLLNSATGEPRANETVSVFVQITNSVGESIYGQTQSATTNDFGILSLAIGNANMFNNVDWSKRPLFISATVDGKFLGKTQILTVPVAGYARNSSYSELANYADSASYARTTGVLKNKIVGTWKRTNPENWVKLETYTFSEGGTYKYLLIEYDRDGNGNRIEETYEESGEYYVDGNNLFVERLADNNGVVYDYTVYVYIPKIKTFVSADGNGNSYIKEGETDE